MSGYHCAGLQERIDRDRRWRDLHDAVRPKLNTILPMPPPLLDSRPRRTFDFVPETKIPETLQVLHDCSSDRDDSDIVLKAMEENGKSLRQYLRCLRDVAVTPEDHSVELAEVESKTRMGVEQIRGNTAIAVRERALAEAGVNAEAQKAMERTRQDAAITVARTNAEVQVRTEEIRARRDVEVARAHESAETERTRINADKEVAVARVMADAKRLGDMADVCKRQIDNGCIRGTVSDNEGNYIRFQGERG